MRYNTPGIISQELDLGSAYTLSSPNLIITLPDGTSVTYTATSNPAGGTSANPHTLSLLYVPTMGGKYDCRFQVLSSAITYNYPFSFWATWNNVYDQIRALLGVNSTQVPDSSIDPEFISLMYELNDMTSNSLPEYYLFTSDYKRDFDSAMVWLVASRLRPYVSGLRSSGEITLFKRGETTIQYAKGQETRKQNIEDMWAEKGWAILGAKIIEIAYVLDNERPQDMTMTRGTLARGNTHPLSGWYVGADGSNLSASISNPFILNDGGGDF